jgi:tRNA (guanine37-N1)-methyltransferase
MRVDILSLFPDYFRGPFDVSILKRAREKGLLDIHLVDIRDFAANKHAKVDDRPYGGGPGMVLMPEPVCSAIRSAKGVTSGGKSHVVYLSPQGQKLTAAKCEELAQKEHLILLCGHYEGVDERALAQEVDEEISIGDYVLTNGCIAAIVIVDTVARFIPGVLGHEEAALQDSFQEGIFDAPHYTRPEVFEGMAVPAVLKTGNHAKIKKWRHQQAVAKTQRVRPDLKLEGDENETE